MARIGIDFGTTKTLVSYCNPTSGMVEVVSLGREGNAAIPTTAYVAADGEFLFADDADDKMEEDPEGYCRAFKLELGEVSMPALSRTMRDGQEQFWTAEEIAQLFLQHLRQRVGEEIPWLKNVSECTLTVPVSGGEGTAWRAALERAARGAGFSLVDFCPEPVAAGRAYLRASDGNDFTRAIIVDWGGGTLDISIVKRLPSGGFRSSGRSMLGRDDIGGEEMDAILSRNAVERWKKDNGSSPFNGSEILGMLRCRRESKRTKEALSVSSSKALSVAFRKNVKVSREDFETLIEPMVADAIELARKALAADAGRNGMPDVILLVGGTSRIPLVGRMFADSFPEIPVRTWAGAAEAVPVGALALPEWVQGARHPWNPDDINIYADAIRGKWESSPGYEIAWRRDGAPSSKWVPGKTDQRREGLVAARKKGTWELLPGYDWCIRGKSAQWVAGRRHPQVDHCHSAKEKDVWNADPGYVFVDSGDIMRGLRWCPGIRPQGSLHVFAGETEGEWLADDGYAVVKGDAFPPKAEWSPGMKMRGHPHVHADEQEGNWDCDRGWKWKTPARNDYSVILDQSVRLECEIANAFKETKTSDLLYLLTREHLQKDQILSAKSSLGVPRGAHIVAIYDDSYGAFGARGFIVAEEGIYLNARMGWAIFQQSTGPRFFSWSEIKAINCYEEVLNINGENFQMGMFICGREQKMDKAFKKLLSNRKVD